MTVPDMGSPVPLTVYTKRRADQNFRSESLSIPVPGMDVDGFVVFAGARLPLRDLVHLLHTLADHLDLGLADGPADRFDLKRDDSESWKGGAA